MIVRMAEPADWDGWLPLWEGYNTFYQRSVPSEVTRTTWDRFFDSTEPVHAVVAEDRGQMLGLVHYLFHRHTAMKEPICYLQDLFTAAEARGKGIGRLLIEAVYGAAKQAGSSRVYWLTHETNTQAQTLYDTVAERSGFIQYRKQI